MEEDRNAWDSCLAPYRNASRALLLPSRQTKKQLVGSSTLTVLQTLSPTSVQCMSSLLAILMMVRRGRSSSALFDAGFRFKIHSQKTRIKMRPNDVLLDSFWSWTSINDNCQSFLDDFEILSAERRVANDAQQHVPFALGWQ